VGAFRRYLVEPGRPDSTLTANYLFPMGRSTSIRMPQLATF
jgi:hypothetical protein